MSRIEDDLNPVDHYYKTRRRGKRRIIDFSELDSIRNPIPTEIRDLEDVEKTFKHFVPYSFINEYSADTFLEWLINIANLSPTHGSVKKKKLRYAFGGELIFERFDPGGFSIGEPADITDREQVEFAKLLQEYEFDADKLKDIAQKAADDFIDTGTAWLEVVRGTKLGEKVAEIHWHDVRNVRFWHEVVEGVKYVGVSEKWDWEHIKRIKPDLKPVYPYWEEQDGVERTFMQIKYGKTFWYGRPPWMQALYPVYNEMKDSEYLIKASSSNFISKYIVEAEEGDSDITPFIDNEAAQELGYKNFTDQINQESTAKGDNPSAFILTERPAGAEPMKVFELKPNSNEKYFDTVGNILKTRIMEAHDWNAYLMGEPTPSGLNDTAHLQNLKIAEGGVLRETRDTVWKPINLALREIFEFHGEGEATLKVNSQNPLQYLIEMLDEAGADTDDLEANPMKGDTTEKEEEEEETEERNIEIDGNGT